MTGRELPREKYLGDAVYASYDGWHIWLRTGDGNDNKIALDPEVWASLQRFVAELQAGPGGTAAT